MTASYAPRASPSSRSKRKKNKANWEWAPRFALAILAIAAVFFVLLLIGNLLLAIPSKFHAKGGW